MADQEDVDVFFGHPGFAGSEHPLAPDVHAQVEPCPRCGHHSDGHDETGCDVCGCKGPEFPLLEETTSLEQLPTVGEWLDAGGPMREVT